MKILSFILLILASLGLTSCYKEKYEGNLIKKDIPLVALGNEYTLTDSMMTAYFYENGNVPLVSIDEFINSLDGYFVADRISRINVLLSNRVRYSWKYGSATLNLDVDYEKDTIKVNDMYFFNFTKPMAGVDVMAYLKETDYKYHGDNSASFNLQKYGFDILNYNDEILVPINILNNLFLATNVTNIIYNGDKFVFVPHYISDSQVKEFRKSSLNGKNAPEDVRIANNKGLYFAMDYFYGLNEVKGFTNGFEEALKQNPALYAKLNSVDPLENRDAYIGIFMHLLDELHSSADYLSYYMPAGTDEINIWDNLGPYWTEYYKLYDELIANYLSKFEHLKVLRYEGNTAFIKFNDFNLGWDDIIYDEEGNLKPDAWKNDTFELMYKVMEMILCHGIQ